ncbi:MAG: iron-containing redox enzyme family protein [Pseudomonadota bacterium]
MQSSLQSLQALPRPVYSSVASGDSARSLYHRLVGQDSLELAPNAELRRAARHFLQARLQQARALPCELPTDIAALPAWIEDNVARVGRCYQEYLAARQAGEPRRYFPSRVQALHFLRAVAPTKLVDGAWLYGLVPHWRDARFTPLIRIYLEELGEGVPDKNHVLLYRQLLAAQGCEDWDNLDDEHYEQGAIQLALGCAAEDFLPELIGFNLGYEQLPLHLLITAFELGELGIDPYYFTLHVTVDNAASGHARQALEGLLQCLPQLGDRTAFYRRVADGYRLNELGVSSLAVIQGFDLDEEVVAVLSRKSVQGRQMHAQACRVAGRTVNDWLSDPRQIPAFLHGLEAQGWIKRHQDPQNSRFWQLIQGPKAQMFGVFSAYEQAVIQHWIAGRWQAPEPARRARPLRGIAVQGLRPEGPCRATDFNSEERLLQQRLAALPQREARLDALSPWLSPRHHHSPVGLLATRLFGQLLKTTEYAHQDIP